MKLWPCCPGCLQRYLRGLRSLRLRPGRKWYVRTWLIVTTEINAFEGSAAMGLVDIGADVALAAGKHGSSARVSGRANREASRAGLDLAGVMRQVAKVYGGEGGGHRAAAALEARGEPAELLDECRKKVAETLQPRQA